MFNQKLAWDYWSEDLAIGIASIDDDHRRILETIARLHEAVGLDDPQPVIDRTLALLQSYVDLHFRREEAMLRAAGYGGLASHSAIHDTFRAYTREQVDSDEPKSAVLLLSYLVNWWTGHIATEDKLYRQLVEGKPEALAAAGAVPPIPGVDAEPKP
jgi:hemerythrin